MLPSPLVRLTSGALIVAILGLPSGPAPRWAGALESRAHASAVEPVGVRHGMVASTNALASRIGVAVLERGGNAVDAAVAVALALAVVWPQAGNLGGGGFMMIRRADGRTEIVDYRERAPLAATRAMYLGPDGKAVAAASTIGHKAVAVPGTVAGLALALSRHGKLSWKELVEPARRLAAEGVVIDEHQALVLKQSAELLGRSPSSRALYFVGARPLEVGDRWVQPELAATLARLAEHGPREFYEGLTARLIAEDMKKNGGLVTLADLKDYQPTLRQPLRGTYRKLEILTMPPPSSGGVLLLGMLNMLERYPLLEKGYHSADEVHLLVEVMRRAFADRAALLGDTDFVKGVPVNGLISKKYAESRSADIDLLHATSSELVRPGPAAQFEKPETTHFTIVDAEGNAVSNTYTLNGAFGGGVVAAGTGILLNNEMDDFAAAPGKPNAYGLVQGENNAIAPRKRPLSTMAPTMVLKDGKLWMAIGSPGGPTIVSTVLQIIVNVVDFGMNLREAIDAPRFHQQWLPDRVMWEPYGLPRELRSALESRGQRFAEKPGYMGDAECVMVDDKSGIRLGASDPRMGGVPQGY